MTSLLQKAVLSISSFALFVGILEVSFHVFQLPRREEAGSLQRLRSARDGISAIPWTTSLAKPHVRGIHKGVFYRSNHNGMRGPEYVIPKPDNFFRIVIVGDSFTMGVGVNEQETYSKRLEFVLSISEKTLTYEVLNLGVPGINLKNSLGRLKRFGLDYQPDLIIYGWTENDLDGRPSYRRSAKPLDVDSHPLRLVRWLAPYWRALRDLVYPGSDSHIYELEENYFRNPVAWSQFLAELDELASLTDDAGVCGVVFLHTSLFSLHWLHPLERVYNVVQQAAEARGLFVVSSLPHFLWKNPESLWIHPEDHHPNADGHEILATALHSGLLELPPRCGLKVANE